MQKNIFQVSLRSKLLTSAFLLVTAASFHMTCSAFAAGFSDSFTTNATSYPQQPGTGWTVLQGAASITSNGTLETTTATATTPLVMGVTQALSLNTGGSEFFLVATVRLNSTSATNWAGVAFNIQDAANYYAFRYSGTGVVQLVKVVTGTPVPEASVTGTIAGIVQNRMYRLRVTSSGTSAFNLSIADATTGAVVWSKTTATGTAPIYDGKFGLYANSTKGSFTDFDGGQCMPLRAAVLNTIGNPKLFLNDTETAPVAYATLGKKNAGYWAGCLETVAKARDAGVHLYRIGTGLSNFGLPSRLTNGITPDYAAVDDLIDGIVAVDPMAKFIVSVGLTPDSSYRIETSRADEMMGYYDIPTGIVTPDFRWDASARLQCPVSNAIWGDVEKSLGMVLTHIEGRYGDRVFMYWPALGGLGEWYYNLWYKNQIPGFGAREVAGFQAWAQKHYLTIEAANAAWSMSFASFSQITVPTWLQRSARTAEGDFFHPKTNAYAVDFFDYWNSTMNDGAKRVAAFIKAHLANQWNGRLKLAGLFAHYLHPLAQTCNGYAGLNHGGQLNIMELATDPNIDCLGAPIYSDIRHWEMPFHGAVDTIQKNGKLYWQENDTLTHLSLNPGHSDSLATDLHLYAGDFQEYMARQCGVWFFDIIGDETFSILNDAAIWNLIGERKKYWDQHLTGAAANFHPEIVVIRSETAARYMVSRNSVMPAVYGSDLNDENAKMIARICEVQDAPVGWYMLDDFLNGKVPGAKIYIFADQFVLKRDDAFRVLTKLNQVPGCYAVWFYAPGYLDPKPLDGTTFASQWYVNRITGGILPDKFSTPVRDWVAPATNALTGGVPEFGTQNTGFSPQFYIRSGLANVQTLCTYKDDPSKIAAAFLPADGVNRLWNSVYVCTPSIASELLANIGIAAKLDIVDGFNDASLGAWETMAGSSWTVINGTLVNTTANGATARISPKNAVGTNFIVQTDVQLAGANSSVIQFRKLAKNDGTGYRLTIIPEGSGARVSLFANNSTRLATALISSNPLTTWVSLKLQVSGTAITAYANGSQIFTVTDASFTNGYFTLQSTNNGSSFDNFRITRLP